MSLNYSRCKTLVDALDDCVSFDKDDINCTNLLIQWYNCKDDILEKPKLIVKEDKINETTLKKKMRAKI